MRDRGQFGGGCAGPVSRAASNGAAHGPGGASQKVTAEVEMTMVGQPPSLTSTHEAPLVQSGRGRGPASYGTKHGSLLCPSLLYVCPVGRSAQTPEECMCVGCDVMRASNVVRWTKRFTPSSPPGMAHKQRQIIPPPKITHQHCPFQVPAQGTRRATQRRRVPNPAFPTL
ncbi:hypothetical protein T440DRAFT_475198 [Plenodomus tracheiphilus IPT5]|uniref:Uncharacterized protein n=1 Tax=Plenodomus tracheiphilus IPT5 TaxID=1408161 RepID=A0A6A7BNX5_9PLEO|nr:hypothetical protein T440DRAFT_475198 [Plenodomus tracheiphilus IPT5]